MKTLGRVLNQQDLSLIESISKRELEDRLISGAATGVAIIACSEMNDVFSEMPRTSGLPVFIWQNFGAMVHESHGLEQLVASKKISDVVIYGHHPCEVIQIGISGENQFEQFDFEPDALLADQLLHKTKETRDMIRDQYGNASDNNVCQKASEDFILRQVALLLEMPVILDGVIEDGLRIHAWMAMSETDKYLSFNPVSQSFCYSS